MFRSLDIEITIPDGYTKSKIGERTTTYKKVIAKNVLITQTSSRDDSEMVYEYSDEMTVNVDLPKDFTENIQSGYFTYMGYDFYFIGESIPLLYSPLKWNRRAKAVTDTGRIKRKSNET